MFKETPTSKKSLSKRKLVYGVAVNDSAYKTEIKVDGKRFTCPIYARWKSLIGRCYSSSVHEKRPTYINCTICTDWLLFSNFRSWLITHDWKGNHLDKDIKLTGNKHYSPETCIFVTQEINSLMNDNKASRGDHPQGVSFHSRDKVFNAHCSVGGKKKCLGTFGTSDKASKTYRFFKSSHIKKVAEKQEEPLKSYLIRISKEILDSMG